jgi:hypothetical protein
VLRQPGQLAVPADGPPRPAGQLADPGNVCSHSQVKRCDVLLSTGGHIHTCESDPSGVNHESPTRSAGALAAALSSAALAPAAHAQAPDVTWKTGYVSGTAVFGQECTPAIGTWVQGAIAIIGSGFYSCLSLTAALGGPSEVTAASPSGGAAHRTGDYRPGGTRRQICP